MAGAAGYTRSSDLYDGCVHTQNRITTVVVIAAG